jgi:hypothetical protein
MTKPQACRIHFYCVSIQAFLNERLHMPTNREPLGQLSCNWVPLLAKGNQTEKGFHTLSVKLKEYKILFCPVRPDVRRSVTLDISEFHCSAVDAFALLGFYAALVISYRRFVMASLSHLQGLRSQSRIILYCLALENGVRRA